MAAKVYQRGRAGTRLGSTNRSRTIDEQKIRQKAYELYVVRRRRGEERSPEDDWLRAEAILKLRARVAEERARREELASRNGSVPARADAG